MNQEPNPSPAEQAEARITALLLGELNSAEAAEVRHAIATDPAWSELHDRLQHTIGIVKEAAAKEVDQPKLSEDRRQALLARFKTITPVIVAAKPKRDLQWLAPLSIAAVLVVLLSLGGLTSGHSPKGMTVINQLGKTDAKRDFDDYVLPTVEAKAMSVPMPAPQAPANSPAPEMAARYGRRAVAATGGLGGAAGPTKPSDSAQDLFAQAPDPDNNLKRGFVALADRPAAMAPEGIVRPNPGNASADESRLSTLSARPAAATAVANANRYEYFSETAPVAGKAQVETWGFDTTERELLRRGDAASAAEPMLAKDLAAHAVDQLSLGVGAVQSLDEVARPATDMKALSTFGVELKKESFGDNLEVAAQLGEPAQFKTELAVEGKNKLSEDGLGRQSGEKSVSQGLAYEADQSSKQLADSKEYQARPVLLGGRLAVATNQTTGLGLPQVQTAARKPALAIVPAIAANDSVALQLDTGITVNRAPAPVPTPEVVTKENRFSTFSLNVADVSFKLAAASLEKGVMPDSGGIRSEEFINAFNYRDPDPAPGMPIAFAWDRAQYPFAHNRDLMRFAVRTAARGREAGRPLNIVLLLDNSGSMERADRVRIVREALTVLAKQLQPQDRVSVVSFARNARLWVDALPGDRAGELAERVGKLTPEGGTNLEEALNVAYATALLHFLSQGVNRVVMLTDGAANLGDVDGASLKKKVENWRQRGVALDCFGIGWEGYNDALLETLSRNGDGRYGFINTPEEATTEFATQLAGALQVAAADVKVQFEFNPQRVTAWRQVGYAKHQLTKEQFRDNTVDAAELAAAESGNALYVVETSATGTGPIGTMRVRYREPATGLYREREWVVPYNGSAIPLDRSPVGIRLAATASAFSEWLAGSPFAAEVTPDRLLGFMQGVPNALTPDPRPQKLEWMIRQAKTISGK